MQSNRKQGKKENPKKKKKNVITQLWEEVDNKSNEIDEQNMLCKYHKIKEKGLRVVSLRKRTIKNSSNG